jgi:hypothetical protein
VKDEEILIMNEKLEELLDEIIAEIQSTLGKCGLNTTTKTIICRAIRSGFRNPV